MSCRRMLWIGIGAIVLLIGCGGGYPKGSPPANALNKEATVAFDLQFMDLARRGQITVEGMVNPEIFQTFSGTFGAPDGFEGEMSLGGLRLVLGPKEKGGRRTLVPADGTVVTAETALNIKGEAIGEGSRLKKVGDWWCKE